MNVCDICEGHKLGGAPEGCSASFGTVKCCNWLTEWLHKACAHQIQRSAAHKLPPPSDICTRSKHVAIVKDGKKGVGYYDYREQRWLYRLHGQVADRFGLVDSWVLI